MDNSKTKNEMPSGNTISNVSRGHLFQLVQNCCKWIVKEKGIFEICQDQQISVTARIIQSFLVLSEMKLKARLRS